MIPEKDRERPMYGIKESIIGKLLIQVMKINKDSEDGYNLRNWKQPGQTAASRMAGDFAGRCFEIMSKRPMRTKPGDMTIQEVNDLLDQLAAANKQESQTRLFAEFYNRMNPDELMWLIRIILRQMKMGASEKTIFNIWHPDADSLFNICSNLRRVCWELYDLKVRLDGEDRGVTLMQCFQPQLAQFQMHSFQKMIDRMHLTEQNPVFWVEEKLDGERMQLHMENDDDTPGGKRFGFWSRKAKDYTYLYGNGFLDDRSSLTRHLKDAFDEGVDNIILDGEMITWDMGEDMMVPFGTLKTAAKEQQDNPYATGWRPLFRVFDILYLNSQTLTNYILRDRRKALSSAVRDVHRRLEIHSYAEAKKAADIDPMLRKVVAEASEGLVLKNPRSAYRLNQRNDDWMKVKPDYMTEFGENLDCLIVGGYYGSGHRGGKLSSFLCGLRVDEDQVSRGANPMKFYSFFKVGGGFTSADLATIRHKTDGKWKKWDSRRPPSEYIALAGDGKYLYEQPDEWILPSNSLVVEVKAASVSFTETFKMGYTLRFPRFKRIRDDRTWENSLSISGFMKLKIDAETAKKEKEFKIDDGRRKRLRTSRKKALTIAGSESVKDVAIDISASKVFEGLNFYIMTGSQKPNRKPKVVLEEMVKSCGGETFQNDSRPGTVCIGDNRTVHVASAMKRGQVDIVKSSWLFDNIRQSEADGDRPKLLLPFEPRHVFFAKEESDVLSDANVDQHGDSYARDVNIDELKGLFKNMPLGFEGKTNVSDFRDQLREHGNDLGELPCWMFNDLLLYADQGQMNGLAPTTAVEDLDLRLACNTVCFAGGVLSDALVEGLTHILIGRDKSRLQDLRARVSQFNGRLPRIVTAAWVEQSWQEKTLLDEERM